MYMTVFDAASFWQVSVHLLHVSAITVNTLCEQASCNPEQYIVTVAADVAKGARRRERDW